MSERNEDFWQRICLEWGLHLLTPYLRGPYRLPKWPVQYLVEDLAGILRARARERFWALGALGMKKVWQIPVGLASLERKWLLPLVASSLLSIMLFLIATLSLGASSRGAKVWGFLGRNDPSRVTYVEDYLVQQKLSSDMPPPPRLGYLISGTRGDGLRMKRVLQAIYHPRNHYILHLDLDAPPRERVELARYIRLQETFLKVGNVFMVGKANLVTYRGSTMVATTLHACALLLKRKADFDWFINLSASDYPLITQDGWSSIHSTNSNGILLSLYLLFDQSSCNMYFRCLSPLRTCL